MGQHGVICGAQLGECLAHRSLIIRIGRRHAPDIVARGFRLLAQIAAGFPGAGQRAGKFLAIGLRQQAHRLRPAVKPIRAAQEALRPM
ncbi:MAG: hypothetical protein WDN76_06720 [Alphaproteobacteria bacterium]